MLTVMKISIFFLIIGLQATWKANGIPNLTKYGSNSEIMLYPSACSAPLGVMGSGSSEVVGDLRFRRRFGDADLLRCPLAGRFAFFWTVAGRGLAERPRFDGRET